MSVTFDGRADVRLDVDTGRSGRRARAWYLWRHRAIVVADHSSRRTSWPEDVTRLSSLIRLRQRPLLGLLADPFGKSARIMELDGDYLRVTRRDQVASMSLQSLVAAPAIRKGMLGTTLTITSGEHEEVTLKGAGHFDARVFSQEVKDAWVRFNLSALEKETAR